MLRDKVVLVNEQDIAIGKMDKMEAHIKGELHRAFSVFIFNSSGQMLIHQRAANKYHGAGLWTNACCSHPQWGENVLKGALDRLQFEMGLQCNIHKSFCFLYNTPVENNLIEHELDHVFWGYTDASPYPHPDEVQDYKWASLDEIKKEINQKPQKFTFWFREAFNKIISKMEQQTIGI